MNKMDALQSDQSIERPVQLHLTSEEARMILAIVTTSLFYLYLEVPSSPAREAQVQAFMAVQMQARRLVDALEQAAPQPEEERLFTLTWQEQQACEEAMIILEHLFRRPCSNEADAVLCRKGAQQVKMFRARWRELLSNASGLPLTADSIPSHRKA